MALITITINTDNAAFVEDGEQEVARILTELSSDIARGAIDYDGANIRDINGNVVGRISLEEEE